MSRQECGDLPRLIVEYLIAKYFEGGYGQLTPTRVMKLLAAALFINPDAKDLVEVIDVHELAHCFRYRIYKYPVYSQVVFEAIRELHDAGRIGIRPIGVGYEIIKGINFRRSESIIADLESGQYSRYGRWEGLIDRINNAIKRFGSFSARELKEYLYEKLGVSTLYIESGIDLIDYVNMIKKMREEGRKISEEERFIIEL